MILTQEQARALYSAMCSLNDVDANFCFTLREHDGPGKVTVKDDPDTWEVFVLYDDELIETYESQPDFAASYGVPT